MSALDRLAQQAASEQADRRVQLYLEACTEMMVIQFGVDETLVRLDEQISFLKEFAREFPDDA